MAPRPVQTAGLGAGVSSEPSHPHPACVLWEEPRAGAGCLVCAAGSEGQGSAQPQASLVPDDTQTPRSAPVLPGLVLVQMPSPSPAPSAEAQLQGHLPERSHTEPSRAPGAHAPLRALPSTLPDGTFRRPGLFYSSERSRNVQPWAGHTAGPRARQVRR